MSQAVVHKSRTIDYQFNFSANGDTSWSFSAEGDGEIYALESSNVASYTINGASVSLPYQVNAGDSYAVAVVKTSAAQAADIKFMLRRATNKHSTFSVPDLTSYNGRYAYCLEEFNGVVLKLDTELLKANNYQGSGVWTVNPIVNSISLPALPLNYYWSSIGFVKSGGVPKIIAIAGKIDREEYFGCFVYVNTDEVYNLEEDAQNAYSVMFSTQHNFYSYPRYFMYDYINEKCWFRTLGGGTAGDAMPGFDLMNKLGIKSPYANVFTGGNPPYNCSRPYFNPIMQSFCTNRYDFTEGNRRTNHKGTNNHTGMIYDIDNGYSVGVDFYGIRTCGYDIYGNKTLTISNTYDGIRSSGACLTLLRYGGRKILCGIPAGYEMTSFFCNEIYLPSSLGSKPIADLTDGQGNFQQGSIASSNYSGLCLVVGGSNTGVGKKRLHVQEPDFDQGVLTQRYMDFANDIIVMVTSQLLV